MQKNLLEALVEPPKQRTIKNATKSRKEGVPRLGLAGEASQRLGLSEYFPMTHIPHLIDDVMLRKVLPRVIKLV